MFLRNFFNRSLGSAPETTPRTLYGAVIDTSDYTLVAIGLYVPALHFLNESMMDTEYVPGILSSSQVQQIVASEPRTYPEWSWDSTALIFKSTNPAIITDSMRERSILAAKKVEAISRAMYWINSMRSKVYTGLFLQEAIYTEKERQARALKDANFDESRAGRIPYVTQYADDNAISSRQAAEEILLQAQLDHEYLARSEKIRLALFRRIRLAKTLQDIDDIVRTFRKTGVV